MVSEITEAGTVLDYTHEGAAAEVSYASVTAPKLERVVVSLNGAIVDIVFVGAGGSHSWWGGSNGPLLPGSVIHAGDHLVVTASGPAAFRLDIRPS